MAIRTNGESRGSHGRRRDIAGRRDEGEMVISGSGQRKAILARPVIVAIARGVDDVLAADHRRRIGTDAILAEHLRRLAGGVVDQGNAHAVDRGARRRIEHAAEGIDQDRIGAGRRIGIAGEEDRDRRAAWNGQRAIIVGRSALVRGEGAREDAAVRGGFGEHQEIVVAGRDRDRDGDDFPCRRIGVAGRVLEHRGEFRAAEVVVAAQPGVIRRPDRGAGDLLRRPRHAADRAEIVVGRKNVEIELRRRDRRAEIETGGVGCDLPFGAILAERHSRAVLDALRRRGQAGAPSHRSCREADQAPQDRHRAAARAPCRIS